jgi:nitrogenase-associated protein
VGVATDLEAKVADNPGKPIFCLLPSFIPPYGKPLPRLHPSAFLSSLILHPPSFIPHPSSLIPVIATVIFYEKPGCINNTKQKASLQAAGHQLQVHNLLAESWTPEQLRSFFGELPVPEWFNRTAPQVKDGEVIPEQVDAATALALMVQNPLLIRRPLMQVGDRREVGFDPARVDAWIGLQAIDDAHQSMSQNLIQQDLQTCPRSHETS